MQITIQTTVINTHIRIFKRTELTDFVDYNIHTTHSNIVAVIE